MKVVIPGDGEQRLEIEVIGRVVVEIDDERRRE